MKKPPVHVANLVWGIVVVVGWIVFWMVATKYSGWSSWYHWDGYMK